MGVAGDLLLRGPGRPGLNVLLFYLALALGVQAVTGRSGAAPSRETAAWLAAGVLMAAGVVVRAAPPLQVLAFLATALGFALPACRAGAAWIRRSGVGEHLEAVAGAVAWSALGASRLVAHRLALRPPGVAVASALVLPILLASDGLLRREAPRDRWVFRVLGGLQFVLLMVVMASAFQRARAYQAAYGLTESRFYGAVFLGWLVLSSVWFGATVFRGRRERFAFPAPVSGFAVVAGLLLVGPDTWIVRPNLARAGVALGDGPGAAAVAPDPRGAGAQAAPPGWPPAPADPSASSSVDTEYLASLGADAVPTLLRALPSLPPAVPCRLAGGLLERWGEGGRGDWRNWNWSVDRARRAVGSNAGRLRTMLGPGGDRA